MFVFCFCFVGRVMMENSKEKVANELHREEGGEVLRSPLRGGNNQGALHFKGCLWEKMMKTMMMTYPTDLTSLNPRSECYLTCSSHFGVFHCSKMCSWTNVFWLRLFGVPAFAFLLYLRMIFFILFLWRFATDLYIGPLRLNLQWSAFSLT